MAYLGSFDINDYVGIPADCHRFSSGAAYAPTALAYSIYEDSTDTGIDENVDMVPASPFDGIVGHYYIRRQLTTAAGFEAGKNYHIVVKATVDSVAAIQSHTFQIGAKVDLTRILGHLLAQTGTQVADAFQAFFDVATPTGNVNSLPAAAPGVNAGLPVLDSNLTVKPRQLAATDLDLILKTSTFALAIADAICDEAINTGHATSNTLGKVIYDALVTEMAKIPKSDSTVIFNDTATAAIQAAADAALVANHLDHLLKTAYNPASKPGAADALLNEVVGDDGGVSQFTANALELGPGGDATLEKQEEILAAIALLSGGGGSVEVDHDYGSTDALRFTTSGGLGIDGATIRAYLKSEWDADLRGDTYVKGRAETDVNGRWLAPMWLDPATYTLAYAVSGNNLTTTKEVTVA